MLAFGVDTDARGMSPQVNIDSYDWNSDYAEMTAAGATSAGDTARLPQSNHSYGYRALTADMGRYESEASAVDAIASSLPYYLPFWAAGNSQQSLPAKGGYQSITYNSLAKNVVTVGATNDAVAGVNRSPGAGTIAGFSSLAGQALYLDDLFSFFEVEPEIHSPEHPRPFPSTVGAGFVRYLYGAPLALLLAAGWFGLSSRALRE